MARWNIIEGDAQAMLATLPAGMFHCCVTSPPYYGLRDYKTGKWEGGDPACKHKKTLNPDVTSSTLLGGKRTTNRQQEGFKSSCPRCGAIRVDKQIGLEDSPAAYVAKLVAVAREVRRVLRDDGTFWLNIGDGFASAPIESEAYVMRDDLTSEEQAYVYGELAKHAQDRSETVPKVQTNATPAESSVS
jgi:DNA modification methylase